MTFQYVCPHKGCGHEGWTIRTRERIRAGAVFICESCYGRLPLRAPARTRKRIRSIR